MSPAGDTFRIIIVYLGSLPDDTHIFPLRLEIEGSGKTWRQDQRIRLHHVDTNGYLHSHDKKYQRIAGGQQEVKVNACDIELHLGRLGGEGRKLFTWCFRKCIIGVVN